jgi:penicillin-insensitive murein endopeptidase
MRRFAAVLPALGLVVLASRAEAGPGPGVRTSTGTPANHAATPAAPPPNAVLPMGRSVGTPTEGHLQGGAHLDTTPQIRIVTGYQPGDVRWGLGSLVGMLDRASRRVRHQFPDAVMSVGHLSKQGGGELDRHASHESGRDADVAFYVKNQQGHPVYADQFVKFVANGTAPTWPGAVFDDAKNWALVAAFLDDPVAHVSHIFVAAHLRARLLAYAARVGAPLALQSRAAVTMVQPHGSLPHDDHFHVRISCPAGMTGCIENPALRHVARRAPASRAPAAHPTVAPSTRAPAPAPRTPPPRTAAVPPPAAPRDTIETKEPTEDDVSAIPASTVAPRDDDDDGG